MVLLNQRGMTMDTLWIMFSIVAEEVQDLERIFREAIESNNDKNLRTCRTAGAFLQGGTKLTTLEAEEGAVNLVGATKHPMVVGGKIFMRAEDNPRMNERLWEASGGWYLGQGASETWTWMVFLNERVEGGWSAARYKKSGKSDVNLPAVRGAGKLHEVQTCFLSSEVRFCLLREVHGGLREAQT
ncbi:hypothetical protein L195_g049696, partial [Trifolium pratense]